jgi:hypothetical protein
MIISAVKRKNEKTNEIGFNNFKSFGEKIQTFSQKTELHNYLLAAKKN